MICEELFRDIQENKRKQNDVTYEVRRFPMSLCQLSFFATL